MFPCSTSAAAGCDIQQPTTESSMNTEQMHGRWREVKGWALEQLGRVTQDPWKRIAGRRERLLGQMQASLAESRSITESTFPAARARAALAERRGPAMR